MEGDHQGVEITQRGAGQAVAHGCLSQPRCMHIRKRSGRENSKRFRASHASHQLPEMWAGEPSVSYECVGDVMVKRHESRNIANTEFSGVSQCWIFQSVTADFLILTYQNTALRNSNGHPNLRPEPHGSEPVVSRKCKNAKKDQQGCGGQSNHGKPASGVGRGYFSSSPNRHYTNGPRVLWGSTPYVPFHTWRD